ncbi:MAG: 1-acyl-sn-glycerol-3-phosphate acyltransferase [Bacteroidetes bacterium]|nr:MAG: 1-acyl-sn-glycerol-3-phosphate acyltransferase [Bacteroidota bacterium]
MRILDTRLGQRLYFAYVLILFLLPLPLVLVGYALTAFLPTVQRLRSIFRINRWWVAFWEMFSGIHFQIHGKENLNPRQPYVLVSNHCNLLDVLLIGSCVQHPWKALAKKEILRVPVLGWMIATAAVVVDRSSPESRKRSLASMSAQMQRGISILVFPEGTRNRTPRPLKEFHTGAFHVAIEAQKPVLPMVMTGIRPLQPVETLNFYPGTGHLHFLEPIPTEGLTQEDVPVLMALARERMYAALVEKEPQFRHLPAKEVIEA